MLPENDIVLLEDAGIMLIVLTIVGCYCQQINENSADWF